MTIQQEWNAIRNHIQASIDKIGSRFYSLERFLSTRFNLVPRFPKRADGISWTYCYHLFLFRHKDVDIGDQDYWPAAEKALDDVASTIEARPDYAVTYSPRLAGSNGSLDIFYAGFSFVALVAETLDSGGLDRLTREILALLRQFHMNYMLLSESSHLLQEILASAIRTEPNQQSDRTDLHEELRQITAAISMMRYRSSPTNYEAGELDVVVYGAAAKAWSLDSVDRVLSQSLSDAEKATSSLSEGKRHYSDVRLSYLVTSLALLTTISVLQDLTSFLSGGESPHDWELTDTIARLVLITLLLGSLVGLVMAFDLLPVRRVAVWLKQRVRGLFLSGK